MVLRAGFARRRITPKDDDLPLRGYNEPTERFAAGTHDDLFLKTVVLTDGITTVGIVSCDLISVDLSMKQRVEQELTRDGIDFDSIILAATHTHAGPWIPTTGVDQIKGFEMDRATERAVSRYVSDLEASFVDSLTEAFQNMATAAIRLGTATNDTAVVNRRSTEYWDTKAPIGGIDPELVVVRIETDEHGEILLFNFACHPVCNTYSQDRYSADWPGRVYDRIESELPDTDVVFLNGAAGDINPRDRYPETTDDEDVYEYMETIGDEIAETVLDARSNADAGRETTNAYIRTDSKPLRLPVKSIGPPEILEHRLDDIEAEETGDDPRVERERHDIEAWLRLANWDADFVPAQLEYVEVGGLGLLTLPGEAVSQYGREFKREASADYFLPVGYSNHNVGYIPHIDDIENGGYEVRTSPLSARGLIQFQNAGLTLLS